MITGWVSGGQGAAATEPVGEGSSAQGEEGGEGEQGEAVMGRAREGRFEGIEEGVDWLGELSVNPVEPAPRRAGLSGLLASEGAELLAGHALAVWAGYTGHGKPPCRGCAVQ